jgi:enoyl-CoA hydratase/carnithine racemase
MTERKVRPVITVDDAEGVRIVTLDRPAARNALTSPAFAALDRSLHDARGRAEVAAVVLTGAGDAFCAGQDLKELQGIDPLTLGSHPFHAFIETLAGFPKPLIAAVRGTAVGAGVTMLPYFDFVVAGTDARFRTPFVALGVPTEGGSSVALPALVGPRLAARMLLLGEWISAEEALDGGLVTEVVEPGDVLARALAIGGQLAALPRAAVVATKRLLVAARLDAVSAAFARERALGLALYTEPDFSTAVSAFNGDHPS